MRGSDQFEIRRYQSVDEQGVIALWKEAFPDDPPRNDPRKNIKMKVVYQPDLFFVAISAGEVVGTVMAGYEGHRGWVNYLAVSQSHRKLGIGVTLMRYAEEALEKIGCIKLNLQVRTLNSEVIEFYQKIGYSIDDVVSMGKELQN